MAKTIAPAWEEKTGALIHKERCASNVPMIGATVYGKSEQVQTTGKNLVPTPANATSNGVTLTNNADGSFTLAGTSNSGGSDFTGVRFAIEDGTYTLSSDIALPSGVYISINNTVPMLDSTGSTKTDSIAANASAYMYIWVNNGTTINSTFKIQLEAGSAATDWEPYTGGKPSPSPEYPQEISSIADVKINAAGKNVIDFASRIVDKTSFKVNFQKTPDGGLNISGTSDSATYSEFLFLNESGETSINPIKVPKGGTYTLSCKGLTGSGAYVVSSIGGIYREATSDFSYTGTFADGDSIGYLIVRVGSWQTANGTLYFQFEEGTESTPYSPYTGTTTPVILTSKDGTKYELRSLPDGTRDELHVDATGYVTLVQRIGKATADDFTSSWTDGASIRDLYCYAENVYTTGYNNTDSIISNMVLSQRSTSADCCWILADEVIALRTVYPDGNIPSIDEVKKTLNSKGFYVYYRLASPVTVGLGNIGYITIPEDIANVWCVSDPSTDMSAKLWNECGQGEGDLHKNLVDYNIRLANSLG